MNTIIRYTILTASRDMLFLGLCLIVVALYGFSVFVGTTALVEQQQMSMAYFSGSSRIVIAIGLIVFVCFHVRRAFENREIESVLSKPISRTQFVFGYWLGFCVLGLLSVIPVFLVMFLFYSPDISGLLLWCTSLVLEIFIMLAFAMLASLIMNSAVSSVLSSFCFYIITRLMGFFNAALQDEKSLLGTGKFGGFLESSMKLISSCMPRLDLFAKSDWLIYGLGDQTDIWVFPVQATIFISLLLSFAVFDFKRKQF